MNQEIILAVSIGICLLSYLFGILTGKVAAREHWRGQIEQQRKQLLSQRRETHQLEVEHKRLQAEHAALVSRVQHERYTLLRGAHELRLASNTFNALNSPEHAQTAMQVGLELQAMANKGITAEQAANLEPELPNRREEMGVAA